MIFNTSEVRAILDGTMTVARKVITPQPKGPLCYIYAGSHAGSWTYPSKDTYQYWGEEYRLAYEITEEDLKRNWTPPCHGDDILYVRETWSPLYSDTNTQDVCGYMYQADTLKEYDKRYPDGNDYQWPGKWKPAAVMPKEAARIFLKVKRVQVRRIQDINFFDVLHSGIPYKQFEKDIIRDFASVWDSKFKKWELAEKGFNANPWVWEIEFEVKRDNFWERKQEVRK